MFMSRFGVLAMMICLVMVLGAGLGNGVNAQCQQNASTDQLGIWYGPYEACDSYVKNIFTGTVATYGGYTILVCIQMADQEEFQNHVNANLYPIGITSVGWWNEDPVTSKKNHKILVDFEPDIPGPKTHCWLEGSWEYRVEYYASPQQ